MNLYFIAFFKVWCGPKEHISSDSSFSVVFSFMGEGGGGEGERKGECFLA